MFACGQEIVRVEFEVGFLTLLVDKLGRRRGDLVGLKEGLGIDGETEGELAEVGEVVDAVYSHGRSFLWKGLVKRTQIKK